MHTFHWYKFHLNLLDITSRYHPFVTFIILNLEVIFHISFLVMCMISLLRKHHLPSLNISLFITKPEYRFPSTAFIVLHLQILI
jgi:hypothetical protein